MNPIDSFRRALGSDVRTTSRKHDVKIGPQVARRNAEDLQSLASDRAYNSKPFRNDPRADRIRSLIPHRIYSSLDKAHNARLNRRWYTVTGWLKRSSRRSSARTAEPSVREAGTSNSARWCSNVPSTTFVERLDIHNITAVCRFLLFG